MGRTERAWRIGLAIVPLFLVGGRFFPDAGVASPTAGLTAPTAGSSPGPASPRPSRSIEAAGTVDRATGAQATKTSTLGTAAPDVTATTATILAAGDIATCKYHDDEATARLLERLRGTIVAVGDLAYPEGAAAAFRRCYGPSWGRFAARTRPVIGNHEYGTGSAEAYLEFFDGAGPVPGRTWYAFDEGSWRAYVLDSDCSEIGGCGPSSAEGRWLAADLAANPRACSIAFMHHPRFSTGHHGDDLAVTPLWRILYAASADIVISGHDHDYERFALLTPDGTRAPGRGIREFVVGTGGAPLRPFPRPARPTSQARDSHSHGILQLELGRRGYSWRFLAVGGSTFSDAGTGTCH